MKSQVASSHLRKLIAKDSELLILDNTSDCGNLTYKQWYDALDAIAESKYWQNVPASERCAHIIDDDSSASPACSLLGLGKDHQPDTCQSSSNSTVPQKTKTTLKKISKKKKKSKKTKKTSRDASVIELCVSSSDAVEDSTSDSGSSVSAEDSDVEIDDPPMPSAHHYQQQKPRSSGKKRDVVTPPIYEMDGRVPLKDFFLTFERYFEKNLMVTITT
jgi:hypothetical protein